MFSFNSAWMHSKSTTNACASANEVSTCRSDVMCNGTPCLENTWVRNSCTTCGAFTVLWEGMNIACFVKQSTTTRMAEKFLEAGSCSMKSIEIDDHGREGIGSCFNFP